MLVKMRSTFTGKINEREINVTQEQIDAWKNSGKLVQDVFPGLSRDDREFLMTGITPEEWKDVFGKDE
jgi:uncharacterized protein (DUF779 family)